ncbi:MAG TPA: copper-containing nitrite reductase [Verrucomicrobiae bacterium]|nr:copper-containing nitrite reductase [Verrucomicrobiae bacterium]
MAWITRAADVPAIVGEENAILTDAPNVPSPITRTYATKVIVHLEVKEVTKQLADGVEYTFWTFGGNVPGKFIRIRQGDEVEFHLANSPDSKMPHNIDLHAVSGPGGGTAASFTAPGHESQFTFRALNAGLYVYHCATAPVGMHIANGMYGLILVQPTNGLPPVDKEFYVMQGEFYTAGKFGDPGLQPFDMDKAIDERPPYVVFNGAVGALSGSNALTARVGEKIRFFIGNGGPNLVSSFHVIGNIFDTVYQDGGTTPIHDVQTTLIPAGGAAIAEFSPKVPGDYAFVDHSIFRAFNKGASGALKVSGEANLAIFSGKQSDTIFKGDASANSVAAKTIEPAKAAVAASAKNFSADAKPTSSSGMESGKSVYMRTCFICHQQNGQGVPNQIPPLAGSDFLVNNKDEVIRIVIQGRQGEVTVNGKTYNGVMIPQGNLNDEQIANVLTYVRNSWGNHADAVTAAEVSGARKTVATTTTANNFE